MRRLLEDVATYLQTLGIGTIGTKIFVGNMPSSPAKVIGIYSTGGESGSGSSPLYRPSIQVINRDSAGNFGNASNMSDYLFQILEGKWNILSRFPGRIVATTLPGINWRDDAGNWNFSNNFQIHTTVTSISTPATL
jgi:hypothetical protein